MIHHHQTVPDFDNPCTRKTLLITHDIPESKLTDLCIVYSWNKIAVTRRVLVKRI
jgi:hypothetical protein